MMGLATFGDPRRLQIGLRWTDDPEGRERRPLHGGWSTGEFRLTVGGYSLTRHRYLDEERPGVQWYLLPVFEWMAANWLPLLHEERFSWRENSAAPAATAVFLALRRLIDAQDPAGQASYADTQAWWSRHALRAADSSALYPDVVFRRLGDEVEVSWTARQPVHAPDGFQLVLTPGAATLSVADVARPIWEALAWAVSTAKVSGADRQSVASLERQIAALGDAATPALESAYLPPGLLGRVARARAASTLVDTSRRVASIPAIERMDDSVLMFGGVSPEIGDADIGALTMFMAAHAGGADGSDLRTLVDLEVGAPLSTPFEEGYDLAEAFLAEAFLADWALPAGNSFVDIEQILGSLGIEVRLQRLETGTIRGVALAGENYAPAILLNLNSGYNANRAGRRFTLAHELFHILYDRRRARRLAHVSGSWAPAGVEKRANAFAAMLLMPRDLMRRTIGAAPLTRGAVRSAAAAMVVGPSALIEHLYNNSLIDDAERDALRGQPRS